MTLIPRPNINYLIEFLICKALQELYAHKQLREIVGGRGHTRGESCTGTLAPILALPGARSMLTALVGNDKGDHDGLKNRRGLDDRAEKHGMSTVHLSI